jgi:hypothetical protein
MAKVYCGLVRIHFEETFDSSRAQRFHKQTALRKCFSLF